MMGFPPCLDISILRKYPEEMNYEIERKFLLQGLPPDLEHIRKERVRQGYIHADENREIRVRKAGGMYFETVKTGSGMSRTEYEILLKKSQFEGLWKSTAGARLEKYRYIYEWQGYKLEIDEYSGKLAGLFTGEVEFPSVRDAEEFPVPPFFGEEITFDFRYKNRNLVILKKKNVPQLASPLEVDGIIGTIPYFEENGEIKVVLVTKRNASGDWIFPKGSQEDNLPHDRVALMEAEEEGGITGEIEGSPIRVPYRRGDEFFNMLAYPVRVRDLRATWAESGERMRKAVSIREAYEMSNQPAVHGCLQYLEQLKFRSSGSN